MSSYQTLQSRVLARLIDTPSAVQAEVPAFINTAIKWLQDAHNFKVMQKTAKYNTLPAPTTSPGTLAAHIVGQIPPDWKEPRERPFYVRQIGSVGEIDFAPAGDRTLLYRQWDPFDINEKGRPSTLFIGSPDEDPSAPDVAATNLNVEIYPYSDSNSDWTTDPVGEYRINLPYWGYVPSLTQPTQTNWFTENGTEFIVDYATSLGFAMDWDEARSQFWKTQAFGARFDGINFQLLGGWARHTINLDKGMAFAPGRVLVPRRDVFGPRDQWRT